MTENQPPVFEIDARRQLFRVLRHECDEAGERLYTALDPNPFKQLEWISDIRARDQHGNAVTGRFAPFRNKFQEAVPALYVAAMPETAYYEAVLRPMGNSARRTLSKKQFEDLEVATLSFQSTLRVADCRQAYLEGGADAFWPYSFDQLFHTTQLRSMDNARSLAKYVADNYPNLDGLVWDSVQQGHCVPVFVLFGPRRPGEIHRTKAALDDIPTWRPYLHKEVARGNLVIAPDLAAIL
ncbi:RES domain-containing protein [Photobacterium sp. 1_MG-2023]|uniref:RES domain-containing protein n=1 Tax=Photobacterium sp. 1_MG-2023 TaxID=3062646 RepID=UPI0026E3E917|nr:RES domain-containing protein [Photobacterium sp. 1_MG-2023]MDO6706957.1 RES domain-containing protein [Photobacterium sp. 1_MG-2023]